MAEQLRVGENVTIEITGGSDVTFASDADADSEVMNVSRTPGKRAMEQALENIRGMAERVAQTVESIEQDYRPDGVEIEFGIVVKGKVGVAQIAEIGSDATFKVKMTWKNG